MTLQHLIKTNDWLSVELTLIALYPDQTENIEAYKEIFYKLRKMSPIESDIQIVLERYCDDEAEEESYVDVSGKSLTPDNTSQAESLAIEFVPWNEWLGMPINKKSLVEFNELEIISHCLYEMTFIGFDEKVIQKQYQNLKKTVEQLKNMSEEEKQANTKSLDDLLKKIDNR